MKWTEEAKDCVAELLEKGLSASQIGVEIGVSRNAVTGLVCRDKRLKAIGFAHIVAISAKKRDGRVLGLSENRIRPQRHSKRLPEVSCGGPHVAGIPLMMLERHHCRWVVNDPERGSASHLFCGDRAELGKSWCKYHAEKIVGVGTEGECNAIKEAKRFAA